MSENSDAPSFEPSSLSVSDLLERIENLEDALLYILGTDWHYRTPPMPKPDGDMRGWAGRYAVRALTGQLGSSTGDAAVHDALEEIRAARMGLTSPGNRKDGSSPQNQGAV